MSNCNAINLLSEIQALAMTGSVATGYDITLHRPCSKHGTSSIVIVWGDNGLPLHRSEARLDAEGNDKPLPREIAPDSCTLAQQRDELDRWIAANRIDKEAA